MRGDTYEGKPCIHGHGVTRYASNRRCFECSRLRNEILNPSRNRNHRSERHGEDGVSRLALQGGRCAVCRRRIFIGDTRTHIDHCHSCKSVRSVLCAFCNHMEGMLAKHDDVRLLANRLADYIIWHRDLDCPDHNALLLDHHEEEHGP